MSESARAAASGAEGSSAGTGAGTTGSTPERRQPERRGLFARIALFLKAAEAIRFAHNRMIAHADVKPSNVMLLDPKTGAPTRTRRQIDEDGTKERISVKSGQAIPRAR